VAVHSEGGAFEEGDTDSIAGTIHLFIYLIKEQHYSNWKVTLPQKEIRNTVKRVDEVVRHPHLVTQDQFTQVSKKVSDIPEENFIINIELFRHYFTWVELLRYKHIPHVEIFR
jgi:hypothetical protein